MRSNTNDPKSTALTFYRRPQMQVVLPLFAALAKPSLDRATHAELVAALARLLLEASGAASDAEVDDDA